MLTNVSMEATRLSVHWPDERVTHIPFLWLRDNCPCGDCRIDQTSEKKFLITEVPVDLVPANVATIDDVLRIDWPDGHRSEFSLSRLCYEQEPKEPELRYWGRGFHPAQVDFASFVANDDIAMDAIREFLASGVLMLTGMPAVSGAVERLQPRLGRIRDMPFGRLHEVKVDPGGYNVAHTALPLPPHNDFASANWPPSIQALHMLVNECDGGETVVVDAWAVAGQLRREQPELFDVLCNVPVPFRMFSEDEETFASNPLIRLDVCGNIAHVRYSNQLMQPLPLGTHRLDDFYRAYHELSTRLNAREARAVFRLNSGCCLLVAGHRVLHAREAFTPSGERHLQDAYFEHDCCRNHLTVLERNTEHCP